MYFLTFDLNSLTPYQHQRYETEKERTNLMNQARNDMRNNPGSAVWYVDVTRDEIVTAPVVTL